MVGMKTTDYNEFKKKSQEHEQIMKLYDLNKLEMDGESPLMTYYTTLLTMLPWTSITMSPPSAVAIYTWGKSYK